MIGYIFKNAVNILRKKPLMLWGVSLLNIVIVSLVSFTGWILPLITIPIILTLNAGMCALYLDGYNGKEVNSKQLFKGFTKECVGRVPAGMLWYQLWNILWALVPVIVAPLVALIITSIRLSMYVSNLRYSYGVAPSMFGMGYIPEFSIFDVLWILVLIAGIVIYVIKSYSYIFTPYILLTKPEVSPLDALKLSMKKTKGYKFRMFGAQFLMTVALYLILFIFALIFKIPFIGPIVCILGWVCTIVLFPLFSGLVMAGFYEEALSGKFEQPVYNYTVPPQQYNNVPPQYYNDAPQTDVWFCTECGAQNNAGANFCTKCGKPRK